ncbi:hypothetical protein BTO06_04175 [Tenacibaculum sp. SZ-18]|nr:hypothetical protein BTO06_04175 [Tenacibaculum sp. SZ-18]
MRGLTLNLASIHQTEYPRGFSEVGETKQLLIAIVASSFLFSDDCPSYVIHRFEKNIKRCFYFNFSSSVFTCLFDNFYNIFRVWVFIYFYI